MFPIPLLAAFMALALGLAPAPSAAQPATSGGRATKPSPLQLEDLTRRPFTGDLDGMIERRAIRVLVPFSKTFFTIDRGTKRGLAFEIGQLLEKSVNRRPEVGKLKVAVVFVVVQRDEILPALREGRGDLAIANLTVTPERRAQIDFAAPFRRDVMEVVVTGPGAQPVTRKEDLAGRDVHVQRSSSFYGSLVALNAELLAAGKAPIRIRTISEDLAIEDILEMTNAGLIRTTVADDHVANLWRQLLPKLVIAPPGAALRRGAEIAWMIRKDSPLLKAELDSLIARLEQGTRLRNDLESRYWKSARFVKAATSGRELEKFERLVAFFRRYGARYDIDHLLIMAQGYQESRLDHSARSPVGAIGVMQVMPATGAELRVGDIRQLEPNIHAGVKYVRRTIDSYYAKEAMTPLDKGLFTLAAYNAGPGRVRQLRREAEKRGLDPNVWFNNVERIAAERIGRETVSYVSNIYKYYLAYRMIEEEREEREAAKRALGG